MTPNDTRPVHPGEHRAPARRAEGPEVRAVREVRSGQVQRWARWVTHLSVLAPLPSTLWRVAMLTGFPLGLSEGVERYVAEEMGTGEKAYILSLCVLSEGFALLALGLIRPWGEVVPRWVPRLGGRTLPPRAVLIPAWTGTVLATLLGVVMVNRLVTTPADHPLLAPGGPGLPILVVCYAPLAAWGPLLAVAVVAYRRRRAGAR
ncbi:hypothetical protein ACFYSC_01565 [Streptosporangium sp. NPDC004379]|uniref:hypothetical protein n=1 Tax=Streptosporangium sp. NPDC004379 TaxID=3366189 RepID=UPI0036B81C28